MTLAELWDKMEFTLAWPENNEQADAIPFDVKSIARGDASTIAEARTPSSPQNLGPEADHAARWCYRSGHIGRTLSDVREA